MNTVPTQSRLTKTDAGRILALASEHGRLAGLAGTSSDRMAEIDAEMDAWKYLCQAVYGMVDPAECGSATPARDGAR